MRMPINFSFYTLISNQEKAPFRIALVDFNLTAKTEISQLKHAIKFAKDNKIAHVLVWDNSSSIGPKEHEILKNISKYTELFSVLGFQKNKEKGNIYQIEKNIYWTKNWGHVNGWVITEKAFQFISVFNEEEIKRLLHRDPTIIELFTIYSPIKYILKENDFSQTMKKRFCFIVPFRNAAQYIQACVDSILNQQYGNFIVYFLDDYSNDNGHNLIPALSNFKIKRNQTRKYALESIIGTLIVEDFKSDDIICLLDGDDLLSGPFVLNVLNDIYCSNKVDLTYGSYCQLGNDICIGNKYSVEEMMNIRNSPWRGTHLKTFKYSLFNRYLSLDPTLSHMKTEDGEFIKMPYDLAIMLPLFEIAGYGKCSFIDLPLYYYRTHEGNDHNHSRVFQLSGEHIIRAKKSIV
jgi:hypothetical protein